MTRPVSFAVLLSVVAAAAGVLRLARLDNRPMHCDEAVHAIKFGRLLECADYVYDPREYHGPSLNFLSLPIARAAGAQKLTETTETHLRLLPAVCGILLVALIWLIRDQLGRPAGLCAAVLTAVSPAMVFYSRYYIQEMLLVTFTFGAIVALWRYARTTGSCSLNAKGRVLSRVRQAFWLVMLGLCIGMMHASKETCVIALFAMAVAAAIGLGPLGRFDLGTAPVLAQRERDCPGPNRAATARRLLLAGTVVVLSAAGISALLFSSFLANPRGVIDSVTTYFVYLGRASGEGSVGRHVYPWYYYFHHLFWFQRGEGPLYSEALVGLLAAAGLIAAALGKGIQPANLPMARFLAVYTALMTLVYCALPYKTPWCGLGFLHGMILLAGVGATAAVRLVPGYVLKALVGLLLITATGHLAWQAWWASFVDYADPSNPYVYAHTTSDVPMLAQRIEQIAAAHPDGKSMHIQVISPDHDYWPLPWYLRAFDRVGWHDQMPRTTPAPLIVTRPIMEPALAKWLYEDQKPGHRHLYVPVPADQQGAEWMLRPLVPLRVYIRLDLRDAYEARQASQAAAPSS